MKVKLLFGIAFALFSIAAWAQADNSQQNTSPGSATPVTVRGCLTGAAGAYVLIADEKGVPYLLRGSNSDLEKMIQHEIEVTGLVRKTANSETSSGQQLPGSTLQVTSVREVADTCAAKPVK